MGRPFSLIKRLALVIEFAVVTAYPSHLRRPSTTTPLLSLASTNTTCFVSNPDIAGIGVRASTYLQFLLLFVTTAVFVFDGFVDSREQRVMEKSYTSLLITACALLFSAIALAARHKLSIYHALIVLDLGWVLLANALVICILPTIDGQMEDKWQQFLWTWWPSRAGQVPATLMVSIHLCTMGGLGLFVWSKLITTGRPGCTQAMITYVFLAPVSAANHRLRVASLIFYGIAAIPILNAVVFNAISICIVKLVHLLIPTDYTFGRLYRITVLLLAVVNALLIASTELTIHKNKHLLDGAESEWGFGQILALILVVFPLSESAAEMKCKIQKPIWRRRVGGMEYRIRERLRRSEVAWEVIYHRLHDHINAVIAFLRNNSDNLAQPDSKAISDALTNAQAFLQAANVKMGNPRTNTNSSEAFRNNYVAPSPSAEEAKKDVNRIREMIVKACDLRFPQVEDSKTFLVISDYLVAASDAVGAAKAALEAQCDGRLSS